MALKPSGSDSKLKETSVVCELCAMLRAFLLLQAAVAFRHQAVQRLRRKPHFSPSTLMGKRQAWAKAGAMNRSSESSSMLETSCESTFRQTGTVLGEGEYGTVSKVQRTGEAGWDYGWLDYFGLGSGEFLALKEVKDVKDEDERSASEYVAEKEIKVMAAAKKQHCEHVLPLIEESPCVGGKKQEYAIVTELMPWDLDKWSQEYGGDGKVPAACYQKVFDALQDGLSCLHAAGYAHLDIKSDNVLFQDLDSEGCPVNLKLADFGLSEPMGALVQKYPKADYMEVNHNPPSMFNGVKDPFKISKKAEDWEGKSRMHFEVVPELDECSFALLMFELFNKHDDELQKKLGEGKCGDMGYDRANVMP